MALLVSIQQAAANALRAWLVKRLAPAVHPDLIYDRWPEATVPLFDVKKERTQALSILLVGAPTDELFSPVIVSETPINATSEMATWRFRCRRQPIHIDAWAAYDTHRDDLIARIEPAINASNQLTLGDATADIVRIGVTLPLADGWTGVGEFLFDGPELLQTPDSNQQSEFRATFRGYVDVMLTQTAVTPLIASIILKQKAHTAPVAPSTLFTDVATITRSGVTYTEVPPT